MILLARDYDEPAWEPHIAAQVVEWLGLHQYAVLGTELWVIRDGLNQYTASRPDSARVVKFASRSDLDDDGSRVSGLGSVEDLLECTGSAWQHGQPSSE